jgi:1-phosphofructokinase
MGHEQHTIAIFAPVLTLTVTIEAGREGDPDEVHFHPGGQGFWVARMLRHLGERPLLCSPVGGETGRVIRGLMSTWGIDMSPVETNFSSPTTVQDRRGGDRDLIAETTLSRLDRHAVDESYGKFLDHALSAGMAVITGQVGEIFPVETYRRLGHDLAAADVKVIGDLHGAELGAFLEGGPLEVLKVSDEDLESDGAFQGDDEVSVLASIERLRAQGALGVVVSRANAPAVAHLNGVEYRATPPDLEAADFRGAGDSMTAALAASVRAGLDATETLKLACGAGAANVTRHGLGSAATDLIASLAARVQVETLLPAPT